MALSNNTCKCIDDVSDGIKTKLIQIIIKSNKLLFQIGESTHVRNLCQIPAQLEFLKRNARRNIGSL